MINEAGLVPIALGLYALVFNRWLARTAVKTQNSTWALHLGERERKGFRITFAVVGVGFVVVGVLIVLNVIQLK